MPGATAPGPQTIGPGPRGAACHTLSSCIDTDVGVSVWCDEPGGREGEFAVEPAFSALVGLVNDELEDVLHLDAAPLLNALEHDLVERNPAHGERPRVT